MGVPVLRVFSYPSFEEEHGRGATRTDQGPPLPLRGRVKKLTEEVTRQHPAWTPAQVREEIRRRLRKETGR